MSNRVIIVLADAEAVPVRALADHLRMHRVDVVRDLRGRGYKFGSIRGAAGHWTMALRRNDAERYLVERREPGTPNPSSQPSGGSSATPSRDWHAARTVRDLLAFLPDTTQDWERRMNEIQKFGRGGMTHRVIK